MAAQKQNFVEKVAMQAGIGLGNSIGTLTKPGSLVEYANNSAGNFSKIAEIGMHAAATMDAKQATSSPSENSSPSFAGSAMGAAALMVAGAVVAPPLAGVAAGIGLVMAARDAKNFSVGHAAVDGARGELTLASAAATFDQDNNMTSYTAACDNVTSDVKSGQSLAAMTSPAVPLKGQHNLDGIVGQVAEKYEADQIQKDVRYMLDKEQKNYSWAANKLEMLGVKDPNAPKDLGVDATMAEIKLDTPRPKALNVGMGAPAAFGMG